MSRLDDELKAVLRRREPSEDFAERVLARIALQESQPAIARSDKVAGWGRRLMDGVAGALAPQPMKWALGSAVMLLLVLGSAGIYRHRERERERVQGEAARAQVMYALQVASVKLNVAQKKVLSIEKQHAD
jgi:hypothetical protein